MFGLAMFGLIRGQFRLLERQFKGHLSGNLRAI